MAESLKDIIISVQNADIVQGAATVLENVCFDIKKGEFVYLIGKTGSGKSSLLKTLYADLELKKGTVEVCGYKIHDIKNKDIPFLRRKMGIVFQDFQLFPDRDIADNLFFVMKAIGLKDKEKMSKRLHYVLSKVGLTGIEGKLPYQLSGGEQQRVAIARALLNDPFVLIADEPTGNLDPVVANEILELFIKINYAGTAVLMATHQHAFLKKAPARVLFCDKKAIKDIPKEEVLRKLE
jgi:cell division transport system ATP-binding protein